MVVRELDGTVTTYDGVDVEGDGVERLLTELFTEHWPAVTVGPLVEGDACPSPAGSGRSSGARSVGATPAPPRWGGRGGGGRSASSRACSRSARPAPRAPTPRSRPTGLA